MGASICCAEAEADTQFTIFDLSALKKLPVQTREDGEQSDEGEQGLMHALLVTNYLLSEVTSLSADGISLRFAIHFLSPPVPNGELTSAAILLREQPGF